MKKIEITIWVEKEGFVIDEIKSDASENRLLMNLKKVVKNE